jgi:hypothetical protein
VVVDKQSSGFSQIKENKSSDSALAKAKWMIDNFL